MRPRNKPRIFITLHARGKNSLGENRTRLGYSAYHWGILISPKNKATHPASASQSPTSPSVLHTHFDVTDSLYVDPATGEVKENWRFRERGSPDPVISFQILARVFVGKLDPAWGDTGGVREKFSGIGLPTKEVEGESCVSWTREAIDVLKRMGALQPDFDIEWVMDTALGFADESLKGKGKIGSILDYTGRGGV